MSKLALRAQTVDIAYLPLRQDFLAKNVLMTAQRDFCFGNSLLIYGSKNSDRVALRDQQSLSIGIIMENISSLNSLTYNVEQGSEACPPPARHRLRPQARRAGI